MGIILAFMSYDTLCRSIDSAFRKHPVSMFMGRLRAVVCLKVSVPSYTVFYSDRVYLHSSLNFQN